MSWIIFMILAQDRLPQPSITLQWGGSQQFSRESDVLWLMPALAGEWRYRRQRLVYSGTGQYHSERKHLEGYRLGTQLALNFGQRLEVNLDHQRDRWPLVEPSPQLVRLITSATTHTTGLGSNLRLSSRLRLKSRWYQQLRTYGLVFFHEESRSRQDYLGHSLEFRVAEHTRVGLSHSDRSFLSAALSDRRHRRHLDVFVNHQGPGRLDFALVVGRQKTVTHGKESWLTPVDGSVSFRGGRRTSLKLQLGRDGFGQQSWSLNAAFGHNQPWRISAHVSRRTQNAYTGDHPNGFYVAEVFGVSGQLKLGRRWHVRGSWQTWEDVAIDQARWRHEMVQVVLQGNRYLRLFSGFYGQDSKATRRDNRWELGLELKNFKR